MPPEEDFQQSKEQPVSQEEAQHLTELLEEQKKLLETGVAEQEASKLGNVPHNPFSERARNNFGGQVDRQPLAHTGVQQGHFPGPPANPPVYEAAQGLQSAYQSGYPLGAMQPASTSAPFPGPNPYAGLGQPTAGPGDCIDWVDAARPEQVREVVDANGLNQKHRAVRVKPPDQCLTV